MDKCIEYRCEEPCYMSRNRCEPHYRAYMSATVNRSRQRQEVLYHKWDHAPAGSVSWSDNHPPMDEATRRRLDAEQYAYDKSLNDRLNVKLASRVLTAEEIEMVKATITPIEQIPVFGTIFWKG